MATVQFESNSSGWGVLARPEDAECPSAAIRAVVWRCHTSGREVGRCDSCAGLPIDRNVLRRTH